MSYTEWKQQVDKELVKEIGLTSDDLPDWRFFDAFEEGQEPKEVAMELIQQEF